MVHPATAPPRGGGPTGVIRGSAAGGSRGATGREMDPLPGVAPEPPAIRSRRPASPGATVDTGVATDEPPVPPRAAAGACVALKYRGAAGVRVVRRPWLGNPVAEVPAPAAREVAGQYRPRHAVAYVAVAHVDHVPLGEKLQEAAWYRGLLEEFHATGLFTVVGV